MSNKSYDFLRESFISFLKRNKDKSLSLKTDDLGLTGKIVGLDTNHKSSDNFSLIHIYKIKDKSGKIGIFMGNIKYNSKMKYFRRSIGKEFSESIEGWRELTDSEMRLVSKV